MLAPCAAATCQTACKATGSRGLAHLEEPRWLQSKNTPTKFRMLADLGSRGRRFVQAQVVRGQQVATAAHRRKDPGHQRAVDATCAFWADAVWGASSFQAAQADSPKDPSEFQGPSPASDSEDPEAAAKSQAGAGPMDFSATRTPQQLPSKLPGSCDLRGQSLRTSLWPCLPCPCSGRKLPLGAHKSALLSSPCPS